MNESAEKLLSRLGIHRIETSNPYSTGKTNCYFIDGASPTLIDTGLATEEAYESLASGLSRAGRRVSDIRRIILTHGHADHRALAPRIREESGAEVLCHQLEAGKVTMVPRRQRISRRENATVFFRSNGVPEELLPKLVEGPKSPSIDPRADRASFLTDGDELEFDSVKLRVLHTPGHSCGSICLYDESSGVLFTGDTLLPVSPITALLEMDMLGESTEYNGLKLHVESLRRLLRLSVSHVLPGHGPVLDEFASLVDALLERHRKRRKHILRSLRNGRRTIYQISRSVFLFISPDDLYLALSEVTGNVGILIDEGKVVRRQEGKLVYYETV